MRPYPPCWRLCRTGARGCSSCSCGAASHTCWPCTGSAGRKSGVRSQESQPCHQGSAVSRVPSLPLFSLFWSFLRQAHSTPLFFQWVRLISDTYRETHACVIMSHLALDGAYVRYISNVSPFKEDGGQSDITAGWRRPKFCSSRRKQPLTRPPLRLADPLSPRERATVANVKGWLPQVCFAHQVLVNAARGFAAFGDSPDN